MFQERSCPACGAHAPGNASVSSRLAAESQDLQSLRPHWNGFFKDKSFFSYHRCGQCGLLYCPVYFSEQELAELYGQMPDNTAGVPVDALRRTQRGYLDALKPYSPPRGAYLEVGPDIGLFTEQCVRERTFSHCYLFEPNRSVWPSLERKLDGVPHTLSANMFGFDIVPAGTVSVAVIIHVLDHLIDPVPALLALGKTLMHGAIVIIVTHDESSLLARVVGNRWPAYCLQHPQLFRPTSMASLLNRAGFNVLGVLKTYNHFPVAYLAKHLLWAFGLKVEAGGMRGLQIPLKLGNILTVATPR